MREANFSDRNTGSGRPEIGEAEAFAFVDAICISAGFAASKRLIGFLRYVVNQTLQGAGDNLNEYCVGVDVYGRPKSFDPRSDNIVRVEARRLRAKLDEYYRTSGIDDEWVITLPRGSYRVEFVRRDTAASGKSDVQRFGPYQILSRTAMDDQWTVYEAKDTELDRPVVLAVSSSDTIRDSGGAEELLEEARRAASISHPNICEIYKTGIEDGVPFIVSAPAERCTLRELLSREKISGEAALDLARQIASGLAAATAKGVRHHNLTVDTVAVSDQPDGSLHAKITGLGRTSHLPGDLQKELKSFGIVVRSIISAVDASGAPPSLRRVADACLSDENSQRPESFEAVLELLDPVRRNTGPSKRRWVVIALVLAAAVRLMGYYYFQTRPITASTPRLVVLPFDSAGGGPDGSGIARGIAASLTGRLARAPNLQVLSKTSADSIKRQALSVREIRARMGVDYVLEGSAIVDETGYRVTVQLIRTVDDTHVWTDEFDTSKVNLLAIQEEISSRVLSRVLPSSTPDERALVDRGGTRNPQALEAYLKGLEAQANYLNNLDVSFLESCERLLLRALELDRGYVDAMTELGRLYERQLYPPRGPRVPWVMKSVSILERALSIEPGNVRANALLGNLYAQEGDVVKGIEYGRVAAARGIFDAEAQAQLAAVYCAGGFYEEALEQARRGLQLDPISFSSNTNSIWNAAKLGRLEEAMAASREFRKNGGSAFIATFLEVDILLRQSKPDAAAALLASQSTGLAPPSPESPRDTALGLVAAMKGDFPFARRIVAQYRFQGPRAHDWIIRTAALSGERDAAIDLLETSTFYRNYRWVVTEDSMAALRKDPRFQDLVRRLFKDWRRNLAAVESGLRHRPPAVPTPEEYFAR